MNFVLDEEIVNLFIVCQTNFKFHLSIFFIIEFQQNDRGILLCCCYFFLFEMTTSNVRMYSKERGKKRIEERERK